jgi:peptidase M28-like protein/type IX secretion system substrate protein
LILIFERLFLSKKNMMRLIPFFCFFLISTIITAQNQIPEINDLQVAINGSIMTVNYDVSDNEDDDLEILLLVSEDDGATYTINTTNATGDVGFPIPVGIGKSISWDFSGIIEMNGNYKVKLIADDQKVIDIQEIVNQVDSNRLRMDLELIEGIRHRTAGAAHLQEVKDMISNQFSGEGLETEIIQFNYSGYTAENIIGWKRGQVTETDTYIIDGHFDSVDDSPGADDNGSAVAGLLEAMRILAPYQFKKSIKFIGFDLEEAGLVGSIYHVGTEGIKPNENIAGVFNFEMIGYYDDSPNSQSLPFGFDVLYPNVYAAIEADQFRGNFVTNVGIVDYPELAASYENAAAAYVPELKVVTILAPEGWVALTPDLGRSDHAAFWLEGHPALMLTDGSEFRYPYYHSPNDTLGNLDFTFMSNVVKATVAAVAELAELSHSTSEVADIEVVTNVDQFADCDFQVSPNPNSEYILIDFKECQAGTFNVEMFNADGQLVYSKKVNTSSIEISTTHLPSGIYILNVRQNQQSIQKKITIVR